MSKKNLLALIATLCAVIIPTLKADDSKCQPLCLLSV